MLRLYFGDSEGQKQLTIDHQPRLNGKHRHEPQLSWQVAIAHGIILLNRRRLGDAKILSIFCLMIFASFVPHYKYIYIYVYIYVYIFYISAHSYKNLFQVCTSNFP